jgi:hypothetical protein
MNSCYGKTLQKPIEDETKYIQTSNIEKFMNRHYNAIKEVVEHLNAYTAKVKLYRSIDTHFNYCHCGVEVLSMSKRIMNEVMCLASDLGTKILYQDTDSMHLADDKIKGLSDAFYEKYGRELIGKNMGQFHSDFKSDILQGEIKASRSIFLGKKCYIDELKGDGDAIDYHMRMKGVSSLKSAKASYKK